MRLNEIDGEFLERTIKSYLSLAYPHGTVPERIQPLLTWEAGLRCNQWCTDDRFEVCKGAQGTQYFLRLGNHFYPNMKLGIVACAGDEEEFVFVADTHDRHFEIDDDQPGALRFREVQRKNEDLKEEIEAQWQMEGIPTFGSFNNFFNQSLISLR